MLMKVLYTQKIIWLSILSTNVEQFITTNTKEDKFICLMEQARGKLDPLKCQQIYFLHYQYYLLLKQSCLTIKRGTMFFYLARYACLVVLFLFRETLG